MRVWTVSDVEAEMGECDVFTRCCDAIQFIRDNYPDGDPAQFLFHRFDISITKASMIRALSGLGYASNLTLIELPPSFFDNQE